VSEILLPTFIKENLLPKLEFTSRDSDWDKIYELYKQNTEYDFFPEGVLFYEPADDTDKKAIFNSFPES
jgi:hypothetical protein